MQQKKTKKNQVEELKSMNKITTCYVHGATCMHVSMAILWMWLVLGVKEGCLCDVSFNFLHKL
jgi:hypothetical protein